MKEPYDVAVAGGGPAGAMAAYWLARAGCHVLLADAAPPRARKVGESLPGVARTLLRDAGLDALIDGGAHLAAYGNASAWGDGTLETTDFARDPHGLGLHLDRARFDEDLRRMAELAGAARVEGRLRIAGREGKVWRLALGRESWRARWVIDATGRGAAVARRYGAKRTCDDDLTALYAWVAKASASPDDWSDARTFVESASYGWWYTSLLPDRTRVVALQAPDAMIAAVRSDQAAFKRLLAATDHVGPLLAGARYLGAPRATEACGARLDRFHGAGWLAVGDAALAFDPLSSQGIYNALYCGLRAGEALLDHLCAERGALARYTERLEAIRGAYLLHRRLTYATERRWSAEPLWRSHV